MAQTKIEWADRVWNPITGCTKVSAGCANCYAERMARRFGHGRVFKGLRVGSAKFSDVICHEKRLEQPLHWRKPCRIFVNSMGDLFHEAVSDDFIVKVFEIMGQANTHTFMVLTKRPKRMLELFEKMPRTMTEIKPNRTGFLLRSKKLPLKNIWIGVSVEDQKTADERIPLLLKTPAAVRFVSVEPMLGPVNLSFPHHLGIPLTRELAADGGIPMLDWVICGGETGPGARPMHPEWARSLRDQCQAAGVPFFFKQWGEWREWNRKELLDLVLRHDGTHSPVIYSEQDGDVGMVRVGKKAAGRLLGGREWNEFPQTGEE